MYLLTIPKCSV